MCDHCWLTATKDHGICNLVMEVAPIGEECPFLKPKNLTCKDYDRYGFDFACFTAHEDDDANECCGFIDKREETLRGWVYEMLAQGRNPRVEIEKMISNFEDSDIYKWIKENQ